MIRRWCGWLTLAMMVVILLGGWASAVTPPGLRLAAIGSFDSFNPFVLRGTAPRGIYRLWMPLMRASAFRPGVLHPAVALSMRVTANPRQVTFTLNPKARFADGAAITPADVIWTFHILTTQGQPFFRSYYRGIKAVSAAGPTQVVFSLRADAGRALPAEIAGEPILPAQFWQGRRFDALLRTPPPGSGPYRIAAVRMGSSITYQLVAHWWGDGAMPQQTGLPRLTYEYFRNRAVARQAFRAGALDVWVLHDPRRAAGLVQAGVRLVALPIREPAGMHGLVFNLRRPALRAVALRHGLAVMFDFPWINRVLLGGVMRRSDSFFSNSRLAARRDVPTLPSGGASGFDDAALRQAVQLLGQAGYRLHQGVMVDPSGARLRVRVIVENTALMAPLIAYRAMLARLGVGLRIDQLDPAAYQARLQARNYDLAYADFPQSRHPGAAEADYFGCAAAARPGSYNLAGLCSRRIDRLIGRLRAAPDRAARVVAAHRLDRALRRRWIIVPGWYQDRVLVAYRAGVVPPRRVPLRGFDVSTWRRR
ncbi:MAG TPA: extracellular solute-binding protein [Acidiphilium sp.]|nr:extracellular solute-binding protein [Acidiphilium sp.]HQU25034.1 extracellular solute-binding protein [Acidiphilium sp.]